MINDEGKEAPQLLLGSRGQQLPTHAVPDPGESRLSSGMAPWMLSLEAWQHTSGQTPLWIAGSSEMSPFSSKDLGVK